MNIHHILGSIFWLLIGAYVTIAAYKLGLGYLRKPGPGFIFFCAGLLLLFLASIDLALTFISRQKTYNADKPLWFGTRWKRVLMVVGVLWVYVYIVHVLGFLFSTFLLMVFLFEAVEPTKWWIAILSSLITILGSYCIFELWLKVSFPTGIMGF